MDKRSSKTIICRKVLNLAKAAELNALDALFGNDAL
jgi:hypothetical protein